MTTRLGTHRVALRALSLSTVPVLITRKSVKVVPEADSDTTGALKFVRLQPPPSSLFRSLMLLEPVSVGGRGRSWEAGENKSKNRQKTNPTTAKTDERVTNKNAEKWNVCFHARLLKKYWGGVGGRRGGRGGNGKIRAGASWRLACMPALSDFQVLYRGGKRFGISKGSD